MTEEEKRKLKKGDQVKRKGTAEIWQVDEHIGSQVAISLHNTLDNAADWDVFHKAPNQLAPDEEDCHTNADQSSDKPR